MCANIGESVCSVSRGDPPTPGHLQLFVCMEMTQLNSPHLLSSQDIGTFLHFMTTFRPTSDLIETSHTQLAAASVLEKEVFPRTLCAVSYY